MARRPMNLWQAAVIQTRSCARRCCLLADGFSFVFFFLFFFGKMRLAMETLTRAQFTKRSQFDGIVSSIEWCVERAANGWKVHIVFSLFEPSAHSTGFQHNFRIRFFCAVVIHFSFALRVIGSIVYIQRVLSSRSTFNNNDSRSNEIKKKASILVLFVCIFFFVVIFCIVRMWCRSNSSNGFS